MIQLELPLQAPGPRVGLFVTCLVDLFRPSVGFAAVRLLRDAGCTVEVPRVQSCCGQPAHASGDHDDARAAAQTIIRAFEGFDHVVTPSGSCAAMLKKHYPALFAGDAGWEARARDFSAKVHELMGFLVDVLDIRHVAGRAKVAVTYHDACSGLRDLGVRQQPRALLKSLSGLELIEIADAGSCCGFGGPYCSKYPEIASATAAEKIENIRASGAGTLLAGDLGCLMNLAGRLKREGSTVEVRHVAEMLAGMTDMPPIGGS